MKVIAFPFAGGDKYSYNFLKPYLLKSKIKMECFDYPGRGDLSEDNFCEKIDDLVEYLFLGLLHNDIIEDEDYIFYGHSMGGVVALLVSQFVEKSFVKNPLKLVVSGCKAPSILINKKIHNLQSEEFWAKLIEMGGTPPEIILENDLKEYYEPILKADFKLISDYNYVTNSKLNVPIDVFYGSQEIHDERDVSSWNLETRKSTSILRCNGNHFFIYENAQYIANHFIHVFRKLSEYP